MLYQLSYASETILHYIMERETGIEPATNSLEGCDSTIELLPHSVLEWTLPIVGEPPGQGQFFHHFHLFTLPLYRG